ncbi:MAG: hypothetical protein EOP06_28775, partial [Proteobacteria bacterium]
MGDIDSDGNDSSDNSSNGSRKGRTSGLATPSISAADLKSSIGLAQFPAACSSSQTLTWSAVTDQFVCQNITVTGTASVTTAALDIYVGSGGSDSCDGLSNTSSGGGSNCRVATLQRALDLVPDIVKHNVVIHVTSGLTANATGPMGMINKTINAANETIGPLLVIQGDSTFTLNNSGNLPKATAIAVMKEARGVLIKNLLITGFETGIDVDGGIALINGVGITNSNTGFNVDRAGMMQFMTNSSSVYAPANGTGISIGGASRAIVQADLAVGLSGVNARGIVVDEGTLELDDAGMSKELNVTDGSPAAAVTGIFVGNAGKITVCATRCSLKFGTFSGANSTVLRVQGGTLRQV